MWTMTRMMLAALYAATGCAAEVEQAIPECGDLRRGDVVALLGVDGDDACGLDAVAMEAGAVWRPVGGDVLEDGASLCVYRAELPGRVVAEVVTVGGMPIDATVTAPPRTTCSCVAAVAEVCMPDGACSALD